MVANNVMEQPAHERVGLAPNQQISQRLKAQVRTLYLVEGHNPKTIEALGIGLTAMQVSNLANREGWSKQRAKAASKIEQTSIARANAAVEAVAEAIAIEGEELCFKALDVTRSGLNKGGLEGAKQAQAASSTLRNIHSVVQAIRKPAEGNADGSGNSTLNIFLLRAGDVAADAKPVTEIVSSDVSPKTPVQ